MPASSLGFGFLAGLVSVLSPCVLPLLPLVLGRAARSHRFGAVALVLGLATSFLTTSLFVASIGFAIGLDSDIFRGGAAILLAGIGLLLVSDRLERRLAFASGRLSSLGDRLESR